jgi:hypothetical protein
MKNILSGLIKKQQSDALLFKRLLWIFCISLIPAVSGFSQQNRMQTENGNTISDYIHSDKRAAIWYFGEHAGIDFQNGTTVPLTDQNVMISYKSNAVVSDSTGHLLFFTDGMHVWDRMFDTMSYSPVLDGNLGVTQPCIIIPQPGSSSIFYIFTLDILQFKPDGTYDTKGLEYSVVDMSLNIGLGNGTSQWNIPLLSPVCQKITAVYHKNGNDVWIITHKWDSDEFYAFLLDSNGLSSPVVSATGAIHGGGFTDQMNAYGYMKASPDGSKIALAISGNGMVELFDFDNTSGTVFNPRTYAFTVPGINPYGIEFSPDSRKVYTSLLQITGNGSPTAPSRIYQFDLNMGMSSPVLIDSAAGERLGGMQLGIDGRIYIPRVISLIEKKDSLDVIYNPNRTGQNCSYNMLGNVPQSRFSLNGRKCIYGLPNMMQSYFNVPVFTYDNVCLDQSTSFNITNKSNIDNVSWDFGDGYTSADISPAHTYSQAGNYLVKLIETFNGSNFKDSALIAIHNCLGVEKTSKNKTIRIFPNPSSGTFTFETSGIISDINATVSNLYGQRILAFTIPASEKENAFIRKDFSIFPKGIYIIRFESNSFNKTEKLIIQE